MARQSRRAVVVPHLQEPGCGDVIAPGVVIRAKLHEELVVARGDRFDDLNAGMAIIVTPLKSTKP